MQDIKNFTFSELQKFLMNKKQPSYCTSQIFNWVYKKGIEDFALMTDIAISTRSFLKHHFYCSSLGLKKRQVSADGTAKFLFELGDKNLIETVLIPQAKRNTLCLSTQVGCKFNCRFCASGKTGFKRDLTAAEIINQYLDVGNRHACSLPMTSKITNIVFMGIGEPLDNFSNSVKAIKILTEAQGLNFSKSKISISTCGLIPEIEKLADLNLGIKLSISLHSADEAKRIKLMPVNKKYPLKDLIEAAKTFSRKNKFPITFEYVLAKDYNISSDDAKKLTKLLAGMAYKLNLIPLNRSCAGIEAASQEEIAGFQQELKKRGVFFTLRKSKGQDIDAACGQLRASSLSQNK